MTKISNEKRKKILPEADFKTLSGNVEKENWAQVDLKE